MPSLCDAPWLLVVGYAMTLGEQPLFDLLLCVWFVVGTVRTFWHILCWLGSTWVGRVCWYAFALCFWLGIAVAAVRALFGVSRTKRAIAFCFFAWWFLELFIF